MALNTSRMDKHYREECPFSEKKKANVLSLSSTSHTIVKPKQSTLPFPKLTLDEKTRLDLKCAALCFEEGAPFKLLESDTFKHIFADPCMNAAYKPPSRKLISGRLLDISYNNWKSKIEETVSNLPYLNVITDGSTNITNQRIHNISIHTNQGSIYHLSKDIGNISMNAMNQAKWLKDHFHDLCNGDFKRINSVAGDTCNVMFSTWEILEVITISFYFTANI